MHSAWIGLSHQGRPLSVQRLGGDRAAVRVLFVCGQHGDERAIRKHLRRFVKHRGLELEQAMPSLQLAIIGDGNPDGYAARTRGNAQGLDLNRDHVLLRAPETRALHEFIRQWRPHLVVDFHNYPSRRKHLVQQQLRLGWDICLDIPTNPAAGLQADEPPLSTLFEELGRVAHREGFHFGRYGLYGRDGSFRHGTPQLGDARNTITLRHEALTILVEVRSPGRNDPPDDRRLLRAAVAATAWEMCGWAVREADYLLSFSLPAIVGTPVPLAFRRHSGPGTLVPIVNMQSGVSQTMCPARDRCQVDARRHRRLPASYRVTDGEALEVLTRQGYQLRPSPDGSNHWDVAVEQRGGRMLALLCEEKSRYRAWQRRKASGSSGDD